MGETLFSNQNGRCGYLHCPATQGASKAKCSTGGGESHLKKSDCHIHATLKQRLDAVRKLRFQHSIKLLCKVLRVNRSTYYKHFSTETAPRVKKNQEIATNIFKIVADYDKRVGAYKITHILKRDYGIKIIRKIT